MEDNITGEWWPDKLKLLEANYEKSKLKIRQNTLRCKLLIVQVQNAVEQEKAITQKYQKKTVAVQLEAVKEELAKQIKEKEDISREAEKIKEEQEELVKQIGSLEKQKENESKLHNEVVQEMSEELDILRKKENEWKCKNLKLNISKLDKIEEVQTPAAEGTQQTIENNTATKFTRSSNIKSKAHSLSKNSLVSPELPEKHDKVSQSLAKSKPSDVFDNRKAKSDRKDNTLIDDGDCLDIETSYLKKTDKILRNCRKQSVNKRRALSDVGVFLENSIPVSAGKGRGKRSRSQTKLKEYNFRSSVLEKKQRRVSFSSDLGVRLFEKEEFLKKKRHEKLAEHKKSPTPDDNATDTSCATATTENTFSVITRRDVDLKSEVVADNGQGNVQELSYTKGNRKMAGGIANERQTRQTTKPEQETVATGLYQEGHLGVGISVESCQNVHPEANEGNSYQENELNDEDTNKDNNQNGRRRNLRKKTWKDKYPEINDVVGHTENQTNVKKVDINRKSLTSNVLLSEVTETNNDLESNKGEIIAQSLTHVPGAKLGRESEKTRFAVEKRPIRELRQYVSGVQPGRRLVETFSEETGLDKRISKQSCEETAGNANVLASNEIEEEITKKKNGKIVQGRKKEEMGEQAMNTGVKAIEKHKEENITNDKDDSGMQQYKRRTRAQRKRENAVGETENEDKTEKSLIESEKIFLTSLKEDGDNNEKERNATVDAINEAEKITGENDLKGNRKSAPGKGKSKATKNTNLEKNAVKNKADEMENNSEEIRAKLGRPKKLKGKKINNEQGGKGETKEVENMVEDANIKQTNEYVVMENGELANEGRNKSTAVSHDQQLTENEEDGDVKNKVKNKTVNQEKKAKVKHAKDDNLVEEFEEYKEAPRSLRKRAVSKDQSKCEVSLSETVIKEKRKRYERKVTKGKSVVGEEESKDVGDVGTNNLEAEVKQSEKNDLTSDGDAKGGELEKEVRRKSIIKTINGIDAAGETENEDKMEKSLIESEKIFLTSLKEDGDNNEKERNAAEDTINEAEKITGENSLKGNRKSAPGKGKSKATKNMNLEKNAVKNKADEIESNSEEICAKSGRSRKLRGKKRSNEQGGKGETKEDEKKSADVSEEQVDSGTEREENSTDNVSKNTKSVKGNNKKSDVLVKPVVDPKDVTMQPLPKKRRKLYNNRENSVMMNKTSALFQETLPLNSTRSGGNMSRSLSTFMKVFIVPKLKKQTASKKPTSLTR